MTRHSVCVLYMVGEQVVKSIGLVYSVLHIIFSAPECFSVELFGQTIRDACLGSGTVPKLIRDRFQTASTSSGPQGLDIQWLFR